MSDVSKTNAELERLALAAEDAAGGPPSTEQVDALIEYADALRTNLEAATRVPAIDPAMIERFKQGWNAATSMDLFGGRVHAGLVAALDGAPEPDREAQLERVAARLREVVYLCGDDLGCQCEESQDASVALSRELGIIAAERPKLTADEVWAIAKAEHDYASDTDNVPAFVMPLVDGLRAAGVAFDEQPFIDAGYLLPGEGEKP